MNSWKIRSLCLYIFIMTSSISMAETPAFKGIIKGMVADKNAKAPIEYATVTIRSSSDNSLVTGAITNNKGLFVIKDIKAGKYNISVSFIGYETREIRNIEVNSSKKITNIGNILLSLSRTVLGEVSIKGNASNVEYKIDKKVVSVSDKLTSSGMSAVEVLENVPSVKVDMDGNIALRGSTNFTVLIDGRPTILDAADVLQQTPASTIQNIEIITNASAKYSPDGTGGIINIITKKNKNMGVSGIVNAKAGSFGSLSSDFLLNLRRKKVNFFVSGNYSENIHRSAIEEEKQIQSVISSEGDSERSKTGKKIDAGLSWEISDSDILDFSATIGANSFAGESSLDYINNATSQVSENNSDRKMDMFSFNGGYVHKFAAKGHQLSMEFNYRKMDMDSYTWNSLLNKEAGIDNSSRTVMEGPGEKSELRLDYSLPISENSKFEAGVQLRDVHKEDASTIERMAGEVLENSLTYDVDFKRKIYSLYSTYSSKWGDMTWQLGLRGEKTVREVSSTEDNSLAEADDFDIFPTAHLSYNLHKGNQLQASYSRRIERPRGFSLLPREIWHDMYNVRKGNPDLKNEYVHVMEVTYLKDWEKSRLSLEAFYRITENKMEHILSTYPVDNIPAGQEDRFADVTLNTVDNVGKSYALGAELMYNIDLFGFWNMSWSADAYNYRISSDVEGVDNINTFNWSASLINKFKINKSLDLQIDNRYNGREKESQSVRKASYSANAALRAKLSSNLSLTAQFRNFLNTWKYEVETVKENYRSHSTFKPEPSFMISLSYRINNFKLKQKKRDGGDEFNDEGEF